MNDADFPVPARAGGNRGGGRGRAHAGQGQHGRQARGQRGQHRADGPRISGAAAHILRFIEFMDVGQTNGWRMDDVVPADEILARRAGRVSRWSRWQPTTPERWPDAGATGMGRRDRRHRFGHPAVLRRGAHGLAFRPMAPATPACSPPGGTTCAALFRGGRDGRGAAAVDRRAVDHAGRPLLRAEDGGYGHRPEGGDVLHRRLTRPGDREPGVTFVGRT